MIDKHFAILGGLLPLAGSVGYAYYTVKGNTRPNRVSWILWTVAPLIAFAAELVQHVGLESILTFVVGFGPLIVVVASFVDRDAYWQVSRFDLICGALSVAALAMWALSGNGNVAIVFSILSDLFAAVPTIVKAYGNPESESSLSFLAGAVGAGITLLAIDPRHWTFASFGFPLYIFVIGLLIATVIRLPIPRPARRSTGQL